MSVAETPPSSLPTTSDDSQRLLSGSFVDGGDGLKDDFALNSVVLSKNGEQGILDSPRIELIKSIPSKHEPSREDLNDDTCCISPFKYRIRYCILVLAMMCLTFIRSDELSFNFTVICMNLNSTTGHNQTPVNMSTEQISTIMAAGGFGALLAVLPMGYLLHQFKPRFVFSILLLLSGLATISLGPLARQAPLWMIPARFVQGVSLSSVLPITGHVSAQWAPLTEIGKFVTMLSAAGQLSQILTMAISPSICLEYGWSSVYLSHGMVSMTGALCFFLLYRNSAIRHPLMTDKEYQLISLGANKRPKRGASVPYMQIAKSKAVWAVWIAFFGNAIGFQLIVQFMPTFLNKALHITVKRTGMFAIIPPIAQLIIKVIAGYASDKINLPEKLKLQLFNSAAQIGCAVCLLPLGYISVGNGTFAIICFSASISFLGLVSCGSMKSATLIARNYTHLVMTIVQLIVCISMLIVPFMVAMIAPNNTVEEYKLVFITVFFILITANTVFCFLCSAEPEPWAVAQKQVLQ